MSKITFIFLFTICGSIGIAQQFLPAFDMFSKNKECYITLNNGTKVSGHIRDIDRKKGLIEEITIMTSDDKKKTYLPKDIKEMYLPPNSFEKIIDMDNALSDVRTYSGEIDVNHIANGMAYFITVPVILKKEAEMLLLQVVNPSFSNKVMVFHDPYAAETMSVGIGGMNVAGGDDKSYFVKVGEKPAFKLKKKNFKEEFENIFASCPEIIQKYKSKINWLDFNEQVYECTTGIDPKEAKKKKKK